ncbi:MAG: hypothetical protein EXS05_12770 [Planctomycetaceae bacterium]|nr:hypothetical protein [Planctomycetaceae bacterium]
MPDETNDLYQRIEALEHEVAELRAGNPRRRTARPCIRKRSQTEWLGLPLWEIAQGPDLEQGELRGHARAIFAVGDVATGVFALGGIARGLVCIGGVSFGVLTMGGVSIGLLFAFGGVAVAPLAFGGVAIGVMAAGGAAVGVYAQRFPWLK